VQVDTYNFAVDCVIIDGARKEGKVFDRKNPVGTVSVGAVFKRKVSPNDFSSLRWVLFDNEVRNTISMASS
jgi:hypothetical protein